MSNKEKFQKRKSTVKISWTIVLLVSALVTYILITSDKYSFLWYLLTLWDFCCIIFWLCSLIGVKFKSYTYNGHDISVYLGMSAVYLLIDDIIVDKNTGSLLGYYPLEGDLNGEKVYLKVGAFTFNNYTLRVGNKILH